MKKCIIIIFLSTFSLFLFPKESSSQCPMCRASVESAMKEEGNTKGLGLNDGIIYLLVFPYIIAGTVFGIWYFKQRKKRFA